VSNTLAWASFARRLRPEDIAAYIPAAAVLFSANCITWRHEERDMMLARSRFSSVRP